ncbi:hypothetical protein [Altererythrobacter sp. ZODW24]|uniref:hypothetical protein n=1 Tax=Altererythrobacter sp. ZODW24 TaxID=2185142 RepID=UPI000DF86A58|nr:hypothetical protein [Altererythrobacter sp. ZODW24]
MTMALTACGGDEFSVDVAQPAHKTMSDLGTFRSGSMVQMLSARPLSKSKPDKRSVLYTMGEKDSQATVLIRVESVDANNSRAHFVIDMPGKSMNFGGKAMIIDEYKVKRGFKSSMQSYAGKVSTGGSKSTPLAAISSLLDTVTVMVDQSSIDFAQRLEDDPRLASELAGSMGSWNDGNTSTDRAIRAASAPSADTRPMDDASGWEPEAMDDTSGASTDPNAYDDGW